MRVIPYNNLFISGKYREGDENHLEAPPHYVATDIEDAINFILMKEIENIWLCKKKQVNLLFPQNLLHDSNLNMEKWKDGDEYINISFKVWKSI